MTKRIFQIILTLSLIGVSATSCKTAAREEKYYEKQAGKDLAKEQKAYDKAVNGHIMNQTKETRKMLRKTDRQSKQLNKSRKPKSKSC